MIALCRAKCWMIQLREDDYDTTIPITQRGVCSHIIVYPQRPSAIARTLPPFLEDILTPVCVVFLGSKPPAAEWLKTKATPLVVRVKINTNAVDQLPEESILPFHIQHIVPDAGIDVTTSDYVPGSNCSRFDVVVTDVDGSAHLHGLCLAALNYMKKAGSNYIVIPHNPKPVNEFNNPHMFPVMYPTLFPYGLGGLENKHGRTRLSFKRRIKHLFNLADPFPRPPVPTLERSHWPSGER
ncbi:hypothetical protein B0H19DRAFT_1207673 [Mycena capillaripes]|nr:hypothetical protein B0H19DRAFT_1207673 [Mycena capillaripes]